MTNDNSPTPLFLKPRLRVFISVDIVGSTALKQKRATLDRNNISEHYAWFAAIQGFYIVAKRYLIESWDKKQKAYPDDFACFGPAPQLWKTVGDEVIFEKEITDHRQMAVLLSCFIEASEKLREYVKKKNSSLNIKCAAWLAGFPIRNKEVLLSYEQDIDFAEDYHKPVGNILNQYYDSDDSQKVPVDYIGPSIDIGFRVANFSTSRKFVLSIGIPYLLSMTIKSQNGLISDFPIYYSGAHHLKGVLGGVNYPIFWIDMIGIDSVDRIEDELTRNAPIPKETVRRYCEKFYDTHHEYTHKPFIVSETETQVLQKPEWWDELHNNLVANFHQEDVSENEGPTEEKIGGIDRNQEEKVSEILDDVSALLG